MSALCRQDIQGYYPNKFIQRDDTDRFYILNTLFNLSGWKLVSSQSSNSPHCQTPEPFPCRDVHLFLHRGRLHQMQQIQKVSPPTSGLSLDLSSSSDGSQQVPELLRLLPGLFQG